MNNPVCLLQWLGPDEYHETRTALDLFADQIDISHYNVSSKNEAREALAKWFLNNSNSQYLFIGSHGIKDSGNNCIGIGSSFNDFVPWSELWDWLTKALYPPVLWLGACRSSYAAQAWSPFPSRPIPVSWIVGFGTDIYPPEIKDILLELMKTTSINRIIYVDQQLDLLRRLIPNTSSELFFPAHTLQGLDEFVNVERFPDKVGIPFSEFLINQR